MDCENCSQSKRKSFANVAFAALIIVLIIEVLVIGAIALSNMPKTLHFDDKDVEAVKCRNFKSYVTTLAEIHYSDDKTLLDISIPDAVVYKDNKDIYHVMEIDKTGDVVDTLNKLRYSTEYEVIEEYIPLVVYYY